MWMRNEPHVKSLCTYCVPGAGLCFWPRRRRTPPLHSCRWRSVWGSAGAPGPSSPGEPGSPAAGARRSGSTRALGGRPPTAHIQSRLGQGPWPPRPSAVWPASGTGLRKSARARGRGVNEQHMGESAPLQWAFFLYSKWAGDLSHVSREPAFYFWAHVSALHKNAFFRSSRFEPLY